MARTRKKAEQPNGARKPAKPRQQKVPAVAAGVSPVPPPLTPPSAGGAEQSEAFERQLREARLLLDAFLQQGREVRSQFEGVSKERQESNREIEVLRQQSQGVHQQLLRDAKEARQLHEKLLNEAKEAREVHQKLLRLAEEGAAQVKRECSSAAGQIAEASRHFTEARLDFETVRGEATEANRQLAALRLELEGAQRRLEEMKQQLERGTGEPSHGSGNPEAPEREGRDRLGVTVDAGVVVSEVTPGTPAAAAGLAPGDIINSVNGTPVLTGPKLRELIQHKGLAEEFTLRVTRGGIVTEIKTHLDEGDEKSAEDKNHLGATVSPGTIVAEVMPGTPAASAGLVRGDVITTVNGVAVLTGAQLRQAVQALEDHAEVCLQLTRGGQTHEVTTRLDEMTAAP